ncbi:hypothetical protein HY970_02555 [Candidatus Kaiserbacteria bacterium]|nr:hypothetical protein [Candidatus Kaiserbacteria bacterium]
MTASTFDQLPIDDAKLVELDQGKNIPPDTHVRLEWFKRTGRDPVEYARQRILEIDRRGEMMWVGAACTLVAMVFMGLLVAFAGLSKVSFFSLLAVVLIVIVTWMSAMLTHVSPRILWGETASFADHLSQLMLLTSGSIAYLRNKSLEELQGFARYALEELALKIIEIEHKHNHAPSQELSAKKDPLTKEMKDKHQMFAALGLAYPDYKVYFNAAQCKFMETQRAQQPAAA